MKNINTVSGYDSFRELLEKADAVNSATGKLNESDGIDCPICHNKGYILKPYTDYPGMFSVECACMQTRKSIKRLSDSGLGGIVEKYTFDDFDISHEWQSRLKNSAMEYAAHPTGWFFMGGQTGAGKTHIGTAICRSLIISGGRSVVYMVWPEKSKELKQKINDDGYQKMVKEYINADVLYIDDLFKAAFGRGDNIRRPSDGDSNLAIEIINARYNNPKSITIISSEYTLEDLDNIVDESFSSKIRERSRGHRFNIAKDRSKNYRLRD